MARDVFISYAAEDKDAAQAICRGLEDAGLTTWIAPRDIRPGQEYGAEIIRGINETSALCVLLSKYSNQSPHVPREIERSVNKEHHIFVFRVEDMMPTGSLEYLLSQVHWVDGFVLPYAERLQELVTAIKSPPLPTVEVPPPPSPGTLKQLVARHKIVTGIGAAIVATVMTLIILGAWLDPDPSPGLVARPAGKPWLFPDSDGKELGEDELSLLSRVELFWARNEMFARHGYIFKTPNGKAYAASLDPAVYKAEEPDSSKLYNAMTAAEIANIAKIKVFEVNRRGLFAIFHPVNLNYFWCKLTQ